MPLIINQTPTKEYSPKFFSDVLTGNGKGMGLLNAMLNHETDRYQHGLKTTPDKTLFNVRIKKSKTTNNNAEYHHIPFTNIYTKNEMQTKIFADVILAYQSAKDVFKVYHHAATNSTYYAIPIHANFNKQLSKNLANKLTIRYLIAKEENGTITTFLKTAESPFIPLALHSVTKPDDQEPYSVYEAIKKMSELFQVHFADITKTYIDSIHQLSQFYHIESLFNLDEFNLTFEDYSQLYAAINQWLQDPTINDTERDSLVEVIMSNTNLLMLDSVNQLALQKNQHVHSNPPKQPVQLSSFLTPEQKEAATTNEPFVLVQAGAGTGKSTTIIERIKYMEASGIDPEKIKVVSLTNAAANNILQKNNKIQSMTIAKYIADIYKINYPKQSIVDYQTLKNTIMVYAKHIPAARELKNLITDKDSMRLLYFIKNNFDEVVKILDLTGQTTLQIQSYISYLKAETFDYGDDQSEHFIVDETQDNNVFEFIYLMKIATLRKASLYIVGDASQTLYEFRGASSQALNAIETSNVFQCIKLDLNFRSNQYILDYANRTLADIDVNKFAQIQLQSNNFQKMTKREFKKTVQIKPLKLETLREFEDDFSSQFVFNIYDYIQDKLDKKEKIVLLARSGRDVQKLEAWATEQFKDKLVTNLVPKRNYSSTLFSSYIEKCWNDLRLTPKTDIFKLVSEDIKDKLYLIYGKRTDSMRKGSLYQINNWMTEQKATIYYLQNQFRSNQLNNQQFMNAVRDNMIQYEIQKNVIRQSLLRQEQDQQDKEQMIEKADILVSTVHSVKGLEFDNVVYLHRQSTTNNEEEKRIDYVALTRAKNSELVLDIYTKRTFSKLDMDYADLLESYK